TARGAAQRRAAQGARERRRAQGARDDRRRARPDHAGRDARARRARARDLDPDRRRSTDSQAVKGPAPRKIFGKNTIDLQWKMRANYNANPCKGKGKAVGAGTMANNEKTIRRTISREECSPTLLQVHVS